MIQQEPLLGYGRTTNDYIEAWGGYYSSHNYVLEILLQGGVIALGFFIKIVLDAINSQYEYVPKVGQAAAETATVKNIDSTKMNAKSKESFLFIVIFLRDGISYRRHPFCLLPFFLPRRAFLCAPPRIFHMQVLSSAPACVSPRRAR